MKTANFTSAQSNEEKRHTHLEVKTCKFTSTQSNRKKRHYKENFDFRKLQILQVHKVTGKRDTTKKILTFENCKSYKYTK